MPLDFGLVLTSAFSEAATSSLDAAVSVATPVVATQMLFSAAKPKPQSLMARMF
jgi:hypothetical protein